MKKVQGVELLLDMAHPDADKLVSELLSGSDFQTAFMVLEAVFRHPSKGRRDRSPALPAERERFQSLLEIARRKHGALVELLPPVFEEQERQLNILNHRAGITSNEQRFFLDLLLNVPDRRIILEMVRQRFPQRNPIDILIDRATELSTIPASGNHGANILGIDDFDDDHLFVYQCLLEELTVEQMKGRLRAEYPPADAERIETRLEELCRTLGGSILLAGSSA